MLEKYPSETAVFSINCSALLPDSETITGTPTITVRPKFTGDAELTINQVQVNTTNLILTSGGVLRPGKVILMEIAGGQSDTDKISRVYSLMATFGTSGNSTLAAKSLLTVLPVGPGV